MYRPRVQMPSTVPESPFVFSPAKAKSVDHGPSGNQQPIGNHAAAIADSGDQTRREIAEIVREVAQAVGSRRDTAQYAAFIVDRIFRATAAAGVILWRYDCEAQGETPGGQSSPGQSTPEQSSLGQLSSQDLAGDPSGIAASLVAIRRCGLTTDRSIAATQTGMHRRLIAEIVQTQTPVVVPPDPTGGDTDPSSPEDIAGNDVAGNHIAGNPLPVAVAIVPVMTQHPLDHGYVIELVFDDQTPRSAWKPFLRFLWQVADLAGQFFVVEYLRRLTRIADYTNEITAIVGGIEPSSRASVIREQFVDKLAEQFDLKRVAWVQRIGDRDEVLAVSHCERIDPSAAGVTEIIAAASLARQNGSPQPVQACWRSGPSPTGYVLVHGHDRQVTIAIQTDVDTDVLQNESSRDPNVAADNIDAWTAADPATLIDPAFIAPLGSAISQTASFSFLATRLERIPLARFWARRPPRHHTRRMPVLIAIAIIAAMLVFFPMPQNVLAPITLQPSESQTIACTRDCIVDSIAVVHGQTVVEGQMLATLRDPVLEDRRLELVGRRSVLLEQRASVGDQLVDPATPRRDFRRLEDEHLLLETQIAGVNDSIDAIDRVIERLTIVARRDGVVDAWRAAEELPGLPMRRGDQLMRIIAAESSWTAIASVPNRRIGWLHAAQRDQQLRAEIAVDGSLAGKRDVRLERFGSPVQIDANGGVGVGGGVGEEAFWVAFELSADDRPDDPAWRAGAPGRVMIHCGVVPLGQWLSGDLIDWTRQQCAAWLGIWRTP